MTELLSFSFFSSSSSLSLVASDNTNFACQLAMMLLRHAVGQMVLASWAAAVAGLAAWYLM